MSSVLLTSYFSQKVHPNDPKDPWVVGRDIDGRISQNDITYIKPWYYSVKSLGLNGFIFYDNLTDEFIEEYTTENIKFIKVNPSDYSNNDWRFFCYRNFLEENNFDNVFLSDGSDVTIVKDPSLIIDEFPYMDLHEKLNWDNLVWFLINQNRLDLINMGVVGGSYKNILHFLNNFCDTRLKLGIPDFNSDMFIGQYVFRHLLSNKNLLIGEPFTSKFKKYEIDRKDVYFIHK